MAYLKFHPAPALQQYVMFYYILEYEHKLEKPLILHSPPKGLGGMVINFSDPYYTINKKSEWEKVSDHFLSGQFTKNYTSVNSLRGILSRLGIALGKNTTPTMPTLPCSCNYELKNNKIVNHWMQADNVALMQQIGASVDAMSGH